MSYSVDKAFVEQFKDNLRHLSQQKGSKLANFITSETVNGKSHHFERLGATTAQIISGVHSSTPLIEADHSRRRVSMSDYNWATLLDNKDKIRMLISPESAYVNSGVWALGRVKDDLIISAALGDAHEVAADGTVTAVPLPAKQKILEAGTDNLTVNKLLEANNIFGKAEVDADEKKYLVLNTSALNSLLQENRFVSSEYAAVKALMDGTSDYYAGFHFIQSERLPGTADGTNTDPKMCFAFTESALGLAVGEEILTKMSERDDKNYSLQVYAEMCFGATRIEDEKVIAIECVQS